MLLHLLNSSLEPKFKSGILGNGRNIYTVYDPVIKMTAYNMFAVIKASLILPDVTEFA